MDPLAQTAQQSPGTIDYDALAQQARGMGGAASKVPALPSAAPSAAPTAAASTPTPPAAALHAPAVHAPAAAPAIDYNALADQARTGAPGAPSVPSSAINDDQLTSLMTQNPHGEGTYKMKGPSGSGQLSVPFSNVQAYGGASWRDNFNDEQEAERYEKDLKATHPSVMQRVLTPLDGYLQRHTGPVSDTERQQILAQSQEAHPIPSYITSDADKQRYQQMAQQSAQAEIQTRDVLRGVMNGAGNLGLHPINAISGGLGMLINGGDYLEKRLADGGLLPFLKGDSTAKGAQEFINQINAMKQQYHTNSDYFIGQQIGQMLLGGKAGELAEQVPGAVQAAPDFAKAAVNKFAREVTGVRPHVAQQLVENTLKQNAAATDVAASTNADLATQHEEDVQNALHTTTGNELSTQQAQGVADEKVQAANDLVNQRHAAKASRIQANNDTINQQITQRQQLEQQYSAATDDYYKREGEVRAQAKAAENAAWQPWHETMDDVSVDSQRVLQPLQKIFKNSPEAKRALAQLTPEPEDVEGQANSSPQVQEYLNQRQQVIQQMMPGKGSTYDDLSPMQQDQINGIMKKTGIEPPQLDFGLDDGDASMTAGQLQRAKSILGLKLMKGAYEGYIKGEMQQVYNVLDRTVKEVSAENDMGDTYSQAKQATLKFNQAFGKDRPRIMTQDELRMKQANPDQYKQQLENEKLAQVGYHDPQLVDQYRNVSALRDQINNMPEVDQLQRKLKPIPEPPTVGDIRPGMALQEPSPVAEPARAPIPDRPEEVQPDIKQLGYDDALQANRDQFTKTVRALRDRGIYVTAALPWLWVVHDLMDMHLGMAAKSSVGAAVSSLGLAAGVAKLTEWLEKPEIRDWVANPSLKDMQEFRRLPANQRKVIASGFNNMWVEAQRKMEQGNASPIKISPLIRGFIALNKPTNPQDALQPGADGQAIADMIRESQQQSPTAQGAPQ